MKMDNYIFSPFKGTLMDPKKIRKSVDPCKKIR